MPITISREQMEQAIKAGGSVLIDGRPVTKLEDLPPADVLAAQHEEGNNAALAALDAQLRPLLDQRAQLLRQQQEHQQARATRTQAAQPQGGQGQQAQPPGPQGPAENAQGQPVYEKAELESWEDDDLKELARHYELDLRQFRTKPNLVAGLLKAQEEAKRRA